MLFLTVSNLNRRMQEMGLSKRYAKRVTCEERYRLAPATRPPRASWEIP